MATQEEHHDPHPGFQHQHHHRTLKETLEGDDKITGAESVSSSRSGSPSPDDEQQPSTTPNGNGAPKANGNAAPSSSKSKSIAYKIKLSLRSSDPIADSHTLPPDELPSHWVSTVVSQLTRAASTAFGQLTSPRNSTSSRTQQQPPKEKEENEKEESHMLHRLTFENPWEKSFRKPGIKTVLNGGLKWGLPDSYNEGSGKASVRASGYKSNKKIQRELEGAKSELGEGWDNVEVVDPDWGWPASGLKHEVDHIRDEDHTQPKRKGDGEEADYKAKEKPVREWQDPTNPDKVAARVTWLGHASTLLQLPPLTSAPPSGSGEGEEDVSKRSINILFDPIFSERCSPSQAAGPQRFTPAPCSVDDLPPIDFVVISHSHYDHLDYHTFRQLRHNRGDKIHAIVPLGVKDKLTGNGGFGWHKEQVSELDWWDHATLTLPSTQADGGELKIICTPAQHGSGRGAGDKDTTLWASWVVQWHSNTSSREESKRFSAFFAGDTGLKYHSDNPHKRGKYPACPAFAEIAKKFAPFDLLLLPISVGSSLSYFRSWDPFPRAFSPFPRVASTLTSSIHMDPYDAVECHEIFKQNGNESRKGLVSLAVHYGTFVRNEEQTRADVRELRKACNMQKLKFQRVSDGRTLLGGEEKDKEEGKEKEDVFLVADQGKTVWLPIHTSS